MHQTILFIICSSINFCTTFNTNKTHQLHIGGTFPMSGDWPGGQACRPAVELAINDINNQVKILKDYHLVLHDRDSDCLPGFGMKMMYELIYTEPKKIALLTGCSTVTTFVAQAAGMWNLIVLAYGASSPALSNRTRFPTFFRTHPSASHQNPTRFALMKHWNWKKITILYQMEEVFASTVKNLEAQAKDFNITITNRRGFQIDPTIHLSAIRESSEDSHIIVGLFYEKMAKRVFCDAYHKGLYGDKYVWIIIGWYTNDWWSKDLQQENINCTAQQMRASTQRHITTESIMWNQDNLKTFSEITTKDFEIKLKSRISTSVGDIGGYAEAPLAYDAIWALALALDRAEKRLKKMGKSLLDFNYSDSLIKDILYQELNSTNFTGISGLVNFDSTGSRISWNLVEQMINGSYVELGRHHGILNNFTIKREADWPNGKIPKDSPEIIKRFKNVSTVLYAGVNILASIITVFGYTCLFFSLRFWNHGALHSAQPILTIFVIFGCIIALTTVFLLGIDRLTSTYDFFSDQFIFSLFCHAKLWPLSLGFSLSFGALFSKIWLVYRQNNLKRSKAVLYNENMPDNYNSPKKASYRFVNQKNKSKKIQNDHQDEIGKTKGGREDRNVTKFSSLPAYLFILFLLSLDILVLSVWQIYRPMSMSQQIFEHEKEQDGKDFDIILEPFMSICKSDQNYFWYGLVFGPKALLLLFGLILAFETRNAKNGPGSDHRFVALAIYNVFILSTVTGSVTLFLGNHDNAFFAFNSFSICLSCGLTLGLLYVPKMAAVWKDPYQFVNKCELKKLLNTAESTTSTTIKIKPNMVKSLINKSRFGKEPSLSSSSGFKSNSNHHFDMLDAGAIDGGVYTGEIEVKQLENNHNNLKENEKTYRNILIEIQHHKREINESEKIGQELIKRIKDLVHSKGVFGMISSSKFCGSSVIRATILECLDLQTSNE